MVHWKVKIENVILVITMIISTSASIRVLGLFPHPGISHFNFFHPIMLGLAEVGHDVTVVGHFPDSHAPSNYKDIKIDGEEPMVNSVDLELFKKRQSFRYFREFFMLYEWGQRSCDLTLNSAAMDKVLEMQQKFDVIIVEQFNSDCMIGVAWKLRAPFIGLSSSEIISYHYDRLGIPLLASHVPTSVSDYTDNMSFLQRLSNWIAGHSFPLLRRIFMDRSDDALLRKKFGDEMPSVAELSKQISMMFVNTHYSLIGPKLLPPTVVELGGVHIKKPKAIDETLQRILDSSEDGVIYLSWGLMIRAESLPVEKREALLKAFATLKQTVLWKWENDTLPNQPANVFIRKWMPQREILCHPNVRVFMTHGGLLGSSEAAYCGVPVIATPIYGDQVSIILNLLETSKRGVIVSLNRMLLINGCVNIKMQPDGENKATIRFLMLTVSLNCTLLINGSSFYNSAALVNRGMGIVLEFLDITKESVENAIQFALDKSTQFNAKNVSHSFRNRPQLPIETAIWWVEYVAATEGAPLAKPHSTFMSFIEYHLIDVYAVVASTVVATTITFFLIIKTICRILPSKTKQLSKKEN